MRDEPPLQPTITRLLETAERYRRIATCITDRQTCDRLLEMAKECEGRASELQGKRG
jgi:hypothetical protein